jgi:hypothetical protein
MAKTPTKNDDDEPKKAPKKDEAEVQVDTAKEPYPTGNPPDPEDEFEKMHGFRREKPKE